MGRVLELNSTSTPLANGETFTGQWEDVAPYDGLVCAVKTDQPGSYFVDFSPNRSDVDSSLPYSYNPTVINPPHRLTVTRRYARVRFINDSGINQTYLRLQTLIGPKTPLAVALNGTLAKDFDCTVVRTVSEALTIPRGLVQGYANNTKFGLNSDVDTGGPEDVWHGGDDYTGFPDTAGETIEVFSDSADDAAAGTGARTLRLIGLDANWDEQTEDVTLNGLTPVVTTGVWTRMPRAYVLTAGSGGANAGMITARHTTTTANVFMQMPIGDNQTLIACDTVPNNKTMIIRRVAAQLGRATASGAADIALRVREPGGVFRKRRRYTVSVGSDLDRHYEGGLVIPEKSDVKVRCEGVTSNNTSIAAEFEYYLVDDT